MLSHIVDFLVDFFTHLNVRKIVGGILVFVGLAIIGRIGLFTNPDGAVAFAILGIIIGGIGFVIIYYDMAKDKISGGHSQLDTLNEAFRPKPQEDKKISSWHMEHGPQSPDSSESPNKNNPQQNG